jgi:hypothetical protein
MMATLGEAMIHELDKKRFIDLQAREKQELLNNEISRFIIIPGKPWKVYWNHLTCFIFVIWIFLAPILVSHHFYITHSDFIILLVFDTIFMLDRFLDLFVGHYNRNGKLEHRLYQVFVTNLSFKFFFEIFISVAPFYTHLQHSIKAYWYAIYKIFRYSRLFEMDAIINNYIESYAESNTVFELKKMERNFDILKFILSTCCNLHIMSCTQILVCLSDYPSSWLTSRDVPMEDFWRQYIESIYFVTTTLSTCGFGDISATRGNLIESISILLLQFFGMIFYSMSI